MATELSSYYMYEASQKQGEPLRRFTIGNSDYTCFVGRWPTLKTSWDRLRPIRLSMTCANGERDFNFLREDPTKMRDLVKLELGFPQGTALYADLVSYAHGLLVDSESDSGLCVEFGVTIGGIGTSVSLVSNANSYFGAWSFAVNSYNDLVFSTWDQTGQVHSTIHPLGGVGTYYISGSIQPYLKTLAVNGIIVSSDFSVASYAIATGQPLSIGIDPRNNTVTGLPNSSSIHGLLLYDAVPPDAVTIYKRYLSTEVTSPAPVLKVPFTSNLQDSLSTRSFITVGSCGIRSISEPLKPFTKGGSEPEMLTILEGSIESIEYDDAKVRIAVSDKFSQLQERIVGTSDVPVEYTGSNYLVSDIAWWLCTSYGGLSSVESTSNPDIDFNSFQEWAEVFSSDSVFLNAKFTGTKVSEGLRKISRVSKSAVYQEDNKLFFRQFSVLGSEQTYLDDSILKKVTVTLDDKDIVNRQFVMAGYDVTSRYHTVSVFEQSSASVNSFGLREAVEKDQSMWLVNSVSARYIAQRVTSIKDRPYEVIGVEVPLIGVLRQVGEMVVLTDDHLGIVKEPYRIMGRTLNMDTGGVSFYGDASQILNGFRLDFSNLDGTDVLS